MFWIIKVVIGDGECGLVYCNCCFQQILLLGVYCLLLFGGCLQVDIYIVLKGVVYIGSDQDSLIEVLGVQLDMYFVLVNVGVGEVGLLLCNGCIDEVLLLGSCCLYWCGLVDIQVCVMVLGDELCILVDVQQCLGQLGVLLCVVVISSVLSELVGLLFIDGMLWQMLDVGLYVFWNFNGNVLVECVELCVWLLDVFGQELFSCDKVILWVNLVVIVQVVDLVCVYCMFSNVDEFVYWQLQFGLCQVIVVCSLDELLGDKVVLDGEIVVYVQVVIEGYGVCLFGVGIKDVILLGEMKEIFNGVVLVEKQVQVSVICCCEEVNVM